MPQGKILDFLDKMFRYMPPIAHVHPPQNTEAKPETAAPEPHDTVQEQNAAGTSFYQTIPGKVGDGGLTPSQYQSVIQQAKPQTDAEIQAIEQLGIKAAKGAAATVGSTVAAGGTVGEGLADALPVAGPGIVAIADAGMIALGGWMAVTGGDIDVNALLGINAAGLSQSEMQIYKSKMAAGDTEGATEFLMQAENRLGTKTIETAQGDYVQVGRNAPLTGATLVDDTEAAPEYLDVWTPRQADRTLLG